MREQCLIKMKKHLIAFLSIGFLANLTWFAGSAFSYSIGEGKDKVENPPDAICRIQINNATFCSGTVVKSNSLAVAKFVTAGHCIKEFTETLKIDCGCTDTGCLESFLLKTSKSTFEKSESVWVDYGVAELDHDPKIITPIQLGDQDVYLNQATGLDCIMGGFGIDKTDQTSSKPNVFRTRKIRLNKNNAALVTGHEFSFFSPEHWNSRPYYQDAVDNHFERVTLPLAVSGEIDFSTAPGDSGSGLLCRANEEEPYQLIGALIGKLVNVELVSVGKTKNKHRERDAPKYIYRYKDLMSVEEVFSSVPKEWFN